MQLQPPASSNNNGSTLEKPREKKGSRRGSQVLRSPKDDTGHGYGHGHSGSIILATIRRPKKRNEKSIILFDLDNDEDDEDFGTSNSMDTTSDSESESNTGEWSDYEDPSWFKDDEEPRVLSARSRRTAGQRRKRRKSKPKPKPTVPAETTTNVRNVPTIIVDDEATSSLLDKGKEVEDVEAEKAEEERKKRKLEKVLAQRQIRQRILGEVPLNAHPRRAQPNQGGFQTISHHNRNYLQALQNPIEDSTDSDTDSASPTFPPNVKRRSRLSVILRGLWHRSDSEEMPQSYPPPTSPQRSRSYVTRKRDSSNDNSPTFPSQKQMQSERTTSASNIVKMKRRSRIVDLHASDPTL